MADENYRRLSCADCSGIFLQAVTRGRIAKRCCECRVPRRQKQKRALKPRYQKKTIYLSKPCKQCGLLLHGTAKQLSPRVFCSPQCNAEDRKQHNIKSCEICLKQFHRRLGGAQRSKGQESRYCSNTCKFLSQRLDEEEVQRRAASQERDRAIRAVATALRRLHRAKLRAITPVCTCSDCKCVFAPMRFERKSVCAACLRHRANKLRRSAKARNKAVRRARLAINAERIDPYEIFGRDRWKCQLCGISTPQSLRGSYDPRAPELDHVIPLALGGAHTWANVQCACRACNIRKGAKALGQLGLEFNLA